MLPDYQNDWSWTDSLPELKGRWLGQPAPGDEPIEFCPEIFSMHRRAFCTAFGAAGDELFFVTTNVSEGISQLVWMHLKDRVWTRPQPAPFNSAYNDNDICISPDGQRVCWRSWRPLPGMDVPEERSVLWAADRIGDGWSAPFPVLCGGEIVHGGYPWIARSGTIYFAGRRSSNDCCVYRAKRHGNMYGACEPILGGMSSGGDLCISPDERFIVIACWNLPENRGDSDLYVTFQSANGVWSPLRNMGTPVNNDANENCPAISPDGERFFFFRYEPATRLARTYWVDARIIERLR